MSRRSALIRLAAAYGRHQLRRRLRVTGRAAGGETTVLEESRRLVRPRSLASPPLIEPDVRFSLIRLSDGVHVAAVAALA